MKKVAKKVVKKAAKKAVKKSKPVIHVPNVSSLSLVTPAVIKVIENLQIDFSKNSIDFEFGPDCHINRDGFLTSNNLKPACRAVMTLVELIYADVQITPLWNRFGIDVVAKRKRK